MKKAALFFLLIFLAIISTTSKSLSYACTPLLPILSSVLSDTPMEAEGNSFKLSVSIFVTDPAGEDTGEVFYIWSLKDEKLEIPTIGGSPMIMPAKKGTCTTITISNEIYIGSSEELTLKIAVYDDDGMPLSWNNPLDKLKEAFSGPIDTLTREKGSWAYFPGLGQVMFQWAPYVIDNFFDSDDAVFNETTRIITKTDSINGKKKWRLYNPLLSDEKENYVYITITGID